MRLPDGVGLDLVREVATRTAADRSHHRLRSTENAIAALKAGAFDYLPKPVDLEQLRALVRSALQQPPELPQPAVCPRPARRWRD